MDYTENTDTRVTTNPTGAYQKDNVPYGRAIAAGGVAGLAMALYLLLVEFLTPEGAGSFIKMGKYLLAAPVFYIALKAYKTHVPKGKIFKRGIVYGAAMSLAAAVVTFGLASLFHLVLPEVEVSQNLREVDTAREKLVLDWLLLFETFVFGMVITFIILQGLKDKTTAE
jgi:hypothetical protein